MLKKLKDALEADTSEDRSSLLEEGIIELIKQRNKLLVISDKYGWETGVAYMLDPIAEDSDDERRIKKAGKRPNCLRRRRKSNQRVRDHQRHGGLQSESSKNRYIKEAKSSLLAVSKAFQF